MLYSLGLEQPGARSSIQTHWEHRNVLSRLAILSMDRQVQHLFMGANVVLCLSCRACAEAAESHSIWFSSWHDEWGWQDEAFKQLSWALGFYKVDQG